jgi:hypothetical protein
MHINNGIAVMREFYSKDGISGDTQTKLESLTDAALVTLGKPEWDSTQRRSFLMVLLYTATKLGQTNAAVN